MRPLVFALAAVGILLFLPTTKPGLAAAERSVSTSRQFVVYGPEAVWRAAICELAERTKKTALTLLAEKDEWKTPIVIDARAPEANYPEAPPAHLRFSQTGSGLKLQLEFRLGADLRSVALEREILRAIFLEMIYRSQPDLPAGTLYVQPPDWLLDGTLALGENRDRPRLAEALATGAAAGRITPLPDFLEQKPALLESPSRTIYRAYSAALLFMLTEGEQGRRRLARFVGSLPLSAADPLADLKAHFPALGESAIDEKWKWSVARFSARERHRLLTCEETEEEIGRLLRFELREAAPSATIYSLEEFPSFIGHTALRPALTNLSQQLALLSARAHPLYRPVIAEYQKIATQLARKKPRRMAQRLAELRGTREHIGRRMSAIGDYMNWFEATQATTGSGAFREYLEAAALAQQPAPRRRDRISVYLDALKARLGQ